MSFYGTNARPEELARQTDDNGEHQAWEDRGQEHEQEMEERHMQLTTQNGASCRCSGAPCGSNPPGLRCRLGLHRYRYHETLIGLGGLYAVRCKRCGKERLTGLNG